MSPDAQEHPEPPEQFAEIFRRRIAADAGAQNTEALDPAIVGALCLYLSDLDAWRRRINLTGRLTPPELVEHTLEALPALSLIDDNTGVLDIGTGAGFPAVPLAVMK